MCFVLIARLLHLVDNFSGGFLLKSFVFNSFLTYLNKTSFYFLKLFYKESLYLSYFFFFFLNCWIQLVKTILHFRFFFLDWKNQLFSNLSYLVSNYLLLQFLLLHQVSLTLQIDSGRVLTQLSMNQIFLSNKQVILDSVYCFFTQIWVAF